jgi:ribonuclease HII
MRRREAGWSHEKRLRTRGYRAVAGVDEVGRGCLAGPVVAGAVILGSRPFCGLADSKTLPPARREMAARRIVRRARVFAFGVVGPEEIDRTDILRATLLAMRRAIEGLRERPDYVLVDALTIPGIEAPQEGIVRGDASVASIAAASILAKVFRDAMMRAYHVLHPVYGFDRHAGYGTPRHLEALRRFGPNHLHRVTFRGVLPPDVAPAAVSSGSH